MADEPNLIRVVFPDEPRTPPYPRAGLNGLSLVACDTGDAQANVELMGATAAERGLEVVAVVPYHFAAKMQPGFLVVIYDPARDHFYDDDPLVHPPKPEA